MPLVLFISFFLSIVPLLFGVKSASAQVGTTDIHSPFMPVLSQPLSVPPHNCDTPNAPPPHLRFTSVYTDPREGKSIVDKNAQKQYKAQIQEIESYEKHVASWLERLITQKAHERDFCIIDWLDNWANQNALLEIDASPQGEATRKWFLATIASHYDILNQNVDIPQEAQQNIENWINRLAYQVMRDYSRNPKNNSRKNNHIYWSAWAVMMASTILDDPALYDWALSRAESGILEIQYNGILPRELSRQRRAFAYHVFATAPLIMIAETVQKNGGDLYSQNMGGLHRLVNFILSELNNKQATFTALTGRKQVVKTTITGYSFAWLAVYNARFPSSRAEKWIKKLSPLSYRRIGGNMNVLFDKRVIDQDKSEE